MRFLITLALFVFTTMNLSAQCSCTDCPFTTISNSTVTSTFDISGATNTILGVNGQYLENVHLDFITDAIDEVNITLIAPNGSSVALTVETGISINNNIFFQICFVDCSLTPIPDPGFSAIFDSDESWQIGGAYIGSYYPSMGCLEDLTGPVNGTWTLQIEDVFAGDDCTFSDWNISFSDNDGTGCDNTNTCTEYVCKANAGELNEPDVELCEGSGLLDFNITPFYPNPPGPSTNLHGYTYIISDLNSGVIIDYLSNPDLTSYSVGEYSICGLSYLLVDFNLIPTADGTYSLSDLQDDIDNDDFCADISNTCFEVIIIEIPTPIFTGPTEVCSNELITYVLENPNFDVNSYVFEVNFGGYSQFNVVNSTVQINWTNGPAQICVTATNLCATTVICIDVEVEPAFDEVTILGSSDLCLGDVVTYQLAPSITTNQSWDFNITNGTIINQTDSEVTIQWSDSDDAGQLCVNILGSLCDPDQACIDVMLFDPPIITDFFSPDSLCLGKESSSFIDANADILSYNWTLTNLIEIDGAGTPMIQYITDQVGLATICLQIETFCGLQDDICKEFNVIELPELVIEFSSPTCDFNFPLITSIESGSSILWSLIDGPSTATIAQPNNDTTDVSVDMIGTYSFQLDVETNGCPNSLMIDVIVALPPSIISEQIICDQDLNYIVSFEIEGDNPPFTVNNLPLSGISFSSSPIVSEDTYSFVVTDSNNCTTEISGTFACDCEIDLGTTNNDEISLCEGDILDFDLISNQDFSLEEGTDTFAILIYNNASDPVDAFIFASFGDDIDQDPNFSFETTYYIRFFITSFENNGEIDLNFDNPCLQFSEAIPLIWHQNIVFAFDIHPTVCTLDDFYTWTNTFPGPFPYTVVFSSQDGIEIEVIVNNAETEISLPIEENGVDWEIISFDGLCDFDFNGNLTITGEGPELLQFLFIDTICNNPAFGSQIDLSSILSPVDQDGIWTIGDTPIVGSFFDFEGYPEGNHPISFSSIGYEGSCPGSDIEGTIYVKNCDCPIVNHQDEISVCSSDNLFDVNDLFESISIGNIVILNPNNLDNPPIISIDNELIFDSASGGYYIISYVLEEEFPIECETTFDIQLLIEITPSTGEMLEDAQYCEENEEIINLADLIVGEDPNGEWRVNNTAVTNPINLQDYSVGIQSFSYSLPATDICPTSLSIYNFEIIPSPIANILTKDVFCFGDENGAIEIVIESENFGPFLYTLNGEEENSTIIEDLPPGNYTVSITNSLGCNTLIDNIIINEPEIVMVDLGGDFEGYFNDAFTIEAIINLLQSDIDTFSWEDINGLIENNGLVLDQNLIKNNTITFTITDINGCVAYDAINLRLLTKEISLANIISLNSAFEENTQFGMPYIESVKEVLTFRIFDRWGNQVFNAENYPPGASEGFWKGNFQGIQVVQGVYGYYLKYENNVGVEKIIIGDVTVIK